MLKALIFSAKPYLKKNFFLYFRNVKHPLANSMLFLVSSS
jgi:hypothetical protein